MDVVLWPHHQYTATYLGDVVIHSTTWTDHLHHLKEVMTANPKECHLRLTEAQYLGHNIGQEPLKPQKKELEAVRVFLWLTTKKQVHA